MPNQCSITITRGRNKGKLCRVVNKTCRHQTIRCPNCGEDFSYKHTYTAHARACMPNRKLVVSPDPGLDPDLDPDLASDTDTNLDLDTDLSQDRMTGKKTTYIRKRTHRRRDDMDMDKSEIIARLHDLERENKNLKDKVQQVAEQPRNINNIMVIGNDFFQELTAKIGKDSAVQFLSSAATTGKPIDVIDKLYLEGKDPMNYPIACRNDDHFRYLSHDGAGGKKLVDDRGGAIIGDLMMNRLRNAFLMAANELISKHVDGTAESDKDVLRSVQNITTVDKKMIVYQLAEATNNSSHPFFLDESECPASDHVPLY